jgi:hypothetical protein
MDEDMHCIVSDREANPGIWSRSRSDVILCAMQTRGLRRTLLALLLIAGAAAGALTFDTIGRFAAGLHHERDVSARIERLSSAAATLAAAHGAYVAPGQSRAEWLARAASSLQLLREEVAMLRPRARSAAAPGALAALAESVDEIGRADAAALEHLRIGEDLMAADLLFAEGRRAFDVLVAQLDDLRAAERAVAEDERRTLAARGGIVLASWAFLWTVGLLGLARVPQQPDAAAVHEPVVEKPPAARVVEAPRAEPRPVDLDEASAICTALARLATTAGLPALLARTARLLEASGVIVWMGAGEELFAATSHGYDPRVVAKIGPIRRHAENATAAAWRAGATRVVHGSQEASGAIVAPLFGPDGCVGVLAVEVPGGREGDAATRAVTEMIAAQLAAIVAAWPAPSAAGEPVSGAADAPGDSQTAATA